MLLQKTQMSALLGALSAAQPVYVPAAVGNISRFSAYGEGVEPRFDLQNVKMPPKDMLFPQTEKMYRWEKRDGNLAIESDFTQAQPFTVFGLRPCDMASIDRLDQAFLTKGYTDEFYQTRRSAATFVVMACSQVSPTCFCESMGESPSAAPSADILLVDAGDAYQVVAQTEKGAASLVAWAPFVTESADEGVVSNDPTTSPAAPVVHCTLSVDMSRVPDALHGMFDDPIWTDIANQCITCGTCTFVCPTCYCFDISQDVRADEGNRFRCWDSCMFSDYTLMAGGHNPRATKASRVRQRFMHKLCYFNDRYGMGLCVGCGRCMRDCPAAVDITLIIDRIAAQAQEKENAGQGAITHA